MQLCENTLTPLSKNELQKILIALNIGIPQEITQAILTVPRLKSCLKYRLLEDIDQQCRALCTRKRNPSVLHVTKIQCKEKIQNFKWSDIVEEMKERAPDLLDFISTVSVPVLKSENQIPAVCMIYGLLLHERWTELSLVQKIVTVILGVGHVTSKVII